MGNNLATGPMAATNGSGSAIPEAANAMAYLDRVLASRAFSSSPQSSRFLRYLVQAAIEGTATALKERIVAVDVFGRAPDYDPQVDPVVRKQAARLRERLLRYYETEGQDDPLRIDLPKGGYVASVRNAPQAADSAAVRESAPEVVRERSYARKLAWIGLGSGVAVLAVLPAVWLSGPGVPMVSDYVQITRDGVKKAVTIGEIPVPIVSDGARVYFTMPVSGGRFQLGEVPVTGGETRRIPSTLESPLALEISPDRSGLLVVSPAPYIDAPLWLQPVPDGSPRRFADVVGRGAAWSPDRSSVVFARNSTLYIARQDGSAPRLLADQGDASGRKVYWPRWSPDGRQLRFSRFDLRTNEHSLWEISADGSGLHPLLPQWKTPHNECCGVWTADGKYFLFVSRRNGRGDIWAIPSRPGLLRKQQPVQITAGPISYAAPLPARDGGLFAIGAESRGELVRYDPAAGQWVPHPAGFSASAVDFSRDGQWTAYVSLADGTLWRARADGTRRLQLTSAPLKVYLPRWSPRGEQIAFYGAHPGEPRAIYLVSPQGGIARRALENDSSEQIDPDWSPDGNRLVFERAPRAGREGKATTLQLLDLRTHQLSQIPGSNGLCSPRWSPDGRYIAAMPTGSTALMLFDVQTGQWTELVKISLGYPNWSRDGRYIYFDRFTVWPGIARIRIADRKVEQVASVQDQDRLWTLATWTGLDPQGQPLLMRDISISEIYKLVWNPR